MTKIKILYQSCVIDSVPDRFDSVCLDDLSKFNDVVSNLSINNNERYIFHVSIEMRKKLEQKMIYPYVIDEHWQFSYEFLISNFSNLIVNEDAEFKTFAQIINQTNNGMLNFPFFMRPSSGDKSFAGQVVNDKVDINTLKYIENVNPLEMCVISPVKELKQETRSFIYMDANKPKIIGITPYWHEGQLKHEAIDESLLDIFLDAFSVNAMLPDMFVADFGVVNGKVHLIELNSIHTSGCYQTKNIDDKIAEIILGYSDYIKFDSNEIP